MNSERLIWQGQKQEKILEGNKLELSIMALRSSLREELNPHVAVSRINHDMVSEIAFEMADKLIRYRQLMEEIAAINNSLGLKD